MTALLRTDAERSVVDGGALGLVFRMRSAVPLVQV